jgi:hypothetical protein
MQGQFQKGILNQLNPAVLFTKGYSGGWTGDDTNDYADITHNAWDEEFNFTCGAWIKCTNSANPNFGIFGTLTGSPVNSDGVGFMVHHSLDSKLKIFFGSPTVPDFVCATARSIPFDKYVFCAYTWNSQTSTIKIYINGVLECTGTATFVHNNHKHIIGDIYATSSNLTWRFSGEIAQFFAIESTLQQDDLSRIYNFGRGTIFQGIDTRTPWYANIKCWSDMRVGEFGIDETANNNNLTIYP